RFSVFLERTFTPILRRRAWIRLKSSINAYDIELKARTDTSKFPSAGRAAIEPVLTLARNGLEKGDLETGWKCLLAAQRIELLYLDGAELSAAAAAIRAEAEKKFSDWRKAAGSATLPE